MGYGGCRGGCCGCGEAAGRAGGDRHRRSDEPAGRTGAAVRQSGDRRSGLGTHPGHHRRTDRCGLGLAECARRTRTGPLAVLHRQPDRHGGVRRTPVAGRGHRGSTGAADRPAGRNARRCHSDRRTESAVVDPPRRPGCGHRTAGRGPAGSERARLVLPVVPAVPRRRPARPPADHDHHRGQPHLHHRRAAQLVAARRDDPDPHHDRAGDRVGPAAAQPPAHAASGAEVATADVPPSSPVTTG